MASVLAAAADHRVAALERVRAGSGRPQRPARAGCGLVQAALCSGARPACAGRMRRLRECSGSLAAHNPGFNRSAPPPPPPSPRTKWTRRVPHPVLIGHVRGQRDPAGFVELCRQVPPQPPPPRHPGGHCAPT